MVSGIDLRFSKDAVLLAIVPGQKGLCDVGEFEKDPPETEAQLKLAGPSKSQIELQMLIVIPSAPVLQNPMLY